MPVKNNAQQTVKYEPKPARKAPGTRLGTLEDWREGSRKSAVSGRHGHAIRDGR